MTDYPFQGEHVTRVLGMLDPQDATRIDVVKHADVNTSAGAPGYDTAPEHYKGANGLQNFDVIDAYELDFYTGNAWKYLARWDKKGNGSTDLAKAVHYLIEALNRAPKTRKLYLPIDRLDAKLQPDAVLESFGFVPGDLLYEAAMDLLLSRATQHPKTYLRSSLHQVQAFMAEVNV